MATFEKPHAVVRTKQLRHHLGLIPLLVIALMLVPWMVSKGLGVTLAFFGVYAFALLALLTFQSRVWKRNRYPVRVDGDAMVLGGERLPRASLGRAYVGFGDDEVFVRFERAWSPIEVVVADESEGRALLVALRLDGASTTSHHWFNNGTQTRASWRLLLVVGIFVLEFVAFFKLPRLYGGTTSPVLALVPILLLIGLRVMLGPMFARVEVGADGVRVRRDLGKEQFFPYESIKAIDMRQREFVLRFCSGEDITCAFGGPWRPQWLSRWGRPRERVRSFVKRGQENLSAHRAREAGALPILARGGRSTAQWLRDLLALSDERANYRVSRLPDDALWRVVENARLSASERAGAAVLLRNTLDATGSARLRATAEACASHRLRRVLEIAATPGAQAYLLERALDEVEEDTHPHGPAALDPTREDGCSNAPGKPD